MRERRDLLVGWDHSPLARFSKAAHFRNIPFPTRRATLKEATRCYNELMVVETSTTSAIEKHPPAVAKKPARPSAAASKLSRPQEPKEKGTAHLKKRTEKPEGGYPAASVENEPLTDEEPEPDALPIEERALSLLKACVQGDIDALSSLLCGDSAAFEKGILFHSGYFKEVDSLAEAGDVELGLLGAACVAANMIAIKWLLEQGVSPCVGASPYLTTKSKAARNALRKYWGLHPEVGAEFAKAGVPGPLTDADADAAAAKRRRDRAKKKVRKDQKDEESKPPDVRAREARAAAAERRLGFGSVVCAQCRKSLAGKVPFERLTFKYCSTDCVSQHKDTLAADAQRARRQ